MPKFDFKLIRIMQNKNSTNIIQSLIDNLISIYNAPKFNSDSFYTIFTDLYNEFKQLIAKSNTYGDIILADEDTINSYRIRICNMCQDFINKDNSKLNKAQEQLIKWNNALNNMDENDPNYESYKANRLKCEKLIKGYTTRINFINNHLNGFTEKVDNVKKINPGFNEEIKTQLHKYPGYDHANMKKIEQIIATLSNTNDFKRFEDLEQDLCDALNASRINIPKIHMNIIINVMDYNSDLLEADLLKACNKISTSKNAQEENIKLLKEIDIHAINSLQALFQASIINNILANDQKIFKELFFKQSITSESLLSKLKEAFIKLYNNININNWYNTYKSDTNITSDTIYKGKSLLIILCNKIQKTLRQAELLSAKSAMEETKQEKIDHMQFYKKTSGTTINSLLSTYEASQKYKKDCYIFIMINNDTFYINKDKEAAIKEYQSSHKKEINSCVIGVVFNSVKPIVIVEGIIDPKNSKSKLLLSKEPILKYTEFEKSKQMITNIINDLNTLDYNLNTNIPKSSVPEYTDEYTEALEKSIENESKLYILNNIYENHDKYEEQLTSIIQQYNNQDNIINIDLDNIIKILNAIGHNQNIILPDEKKFINNFINYLNTAKDINSESNIQNPIYKLIIDQFISQQGTNFNDAHSSNDLNYWEYMNFEQCINFIKNILKEYFANTGDNISTLKFADFQNYLNILKNIKPSENPRHNDPSYKSPQTQKFIAGCLKQVNSSKYKKLINKFIENNLSFDDLNFETYLAFKNDLGLNKTTETTNPVQSFINLFQSEMKNPAIISIENIDKKPDIKGRRKVRTTYKSGRPFIQHFNNWLNNYIYNQYKELANYIFEQLKNQFNINDIRDIIQDKAEKHIPVYIKQKKYKPYEDSKKSNYQFKTEKAEGNESLSKKIDEQNKLYNQIEDQIKQLQSIFKDEYNSISEWLKSFKNNPDVRNIQIQYKKAANDNIYTNINNLIYKYDITDNQDKRRTLLARLNKQINIYLTIPINSIINSINNLYKLWAKENKANINNDITKKILIQSNYNNIIKAIHNQVGLNGARILVQIEEPLTGKAFTVIAKNKRRTKI